MYYIKKFAEKTAAEKKEFAPQGARVYQRAANAVFFMRRISPGSSFVNAKHFLPKSFKDRIVAALRTGELSKAEIAAAIGLGRVSGYLNRAVRALLADGLIEPTLADVFDRLDYMEREGSGFKKIVGAYSPDVSRNPLGLAPRFYSAVGCFVVTLPSLNERKGAGEAEGKTALGSVKGRVGAESGQSRGRAA